jgi:hypothetical protein
MELGYTNGYKLVVSSILFYHDCFCWLNYGSVVSVAPGKEIAAAIVTKMPIATITIAAAAAFSILFLTCPLLFYPPPLAAAAASSSPSSPSAAAASAPSSSVTPMVPLAASIIIGPNVSPASVLILATGVSLV